MPRKARGESGRWRAQQDRDPYVKKARQSGFRARSVFKLEQIDRKYRLLKPNSAIIDLGSAPGSWSQYLAKAADAKSQIIAVDLIAMQTIERVSFIHGDFTGDAVIAQITDTLQGRLLDLVLSDMAPNLSGIQSTDQARAEALQHAIIKFCESTLKQNGQLLTKLFAGESAADTQKQISDCFKQVRIIKPEASRSQSKEFYLLASGYHGGVKSGVN